MSSRILVLGCGDLGSAVAHRLFLQGAAVESALIDDARDSVALLEVTDAVLCTATAHHEVIRALRPDAIVDARMREHFTSEDLRTSVPIVLGIRPDAIARGVSRATGLPCDMSHALAPFEMSHWHALPPEVRETLLETRTAGPAHVQRLSRFLHRYARQLNWPELPTSFKCAANVSRW